MSDPTAQAAQAAQEATPRRRGPIALVLVLLLGGGGVLAGFVMDLGGALGVSSASLAVEQATSLGEVLPPEHREWAAEAPGELHAEAWKSIKAAGANGRVYLTTDDTSQSARERVATLVANFRNNEYVDREAKRGRLKLWVRTRKLPEGTRVYGLRYAVFEDRGEFEDQVLGPPLASGYLRAAPYRGHEVKFEQDVDLSYLDSPPHFRVSLLLVTDQGLRRAVWSCGLYHDPTAAEEGE